SRSSASRCPYRGSALSIKIRCFFQFFTFPPRVIPDRTAVPAASKLVIACGAQRQHHEDFTWSAQQCNTDTIKARSGCSRAWRDGDRLATGRIRARLSGGPEQPAKRALGGAQRGKRFEVALEAEQERTLVRRAWRPASLVLQLAYLLQSALEPAVHRRCGGT